jgi:hypothetical protein
MQTRLGVSTCSRPVPSPSLHGGATVPVLVTAHPAKPCPTGPMVRARNSLCRQLLAAPEVEKPPQFSRTGRFLRSCPTPETHTDRATWQTQTANVAELLWGTLKETN